MNSKVIILNSKDYPLKLANIQEAPNVLYALGNINLLYEDSFAIVGTRNPTEYGVKACEILAKELSLRDIPIVSGMALGIDKIAHETALKFNSRTIAVLGSGFGKIYPKENSNLFYEIIKNNGLILSEYSIETPKSKEYFPQRNRIIAALSEGVLAIEAAYRSGSSITINFAKKYGKKTFSVPGRIGDKMSVGTNNFIKDGAELVTKIEDILKFYPQFANKKRKTLHRNFKKSTGENRIIKTEWKEIYYLIDKGMNTLEEIQINTSKDTRIILNILSEMELNGIIEQEIGTGYTIIK